jgi:hypothetical protein
MYTRFQPKKKIEGKEYSGDQRINDRIAVKFILKKWCVRSIHLLNYRIQLTAFFEHTQEPSSSVKVRGFLKQVWHYKLLKKGSAP